MENNSNTVQSSKVDIAGHIAIIKYNAGNVQSVLYALERMGYTAIVTDDPEAIRTAAKVIFPGVGHANAAMQYLKERELDKVIVSLKQPLLGICLGLQLLCSHSEEGDTKCLGIFDTEIKLFQNSTLTTMAETAVSVLKIPQIGWNNMYDYKSVLFKGLTDDAFVYTVHSYYAAISEETVAKTDYILPYSAALQKNNFYAVQFHPEKSGEIGEKVLKNFIELT